MIFFYEKQWDFLVRMAKSGKIPHALLFLGQEKLGKREMAIEFSKFLLKSNPFSHPDFILVEPINNLISISQIRDLIWKLSLRPFSAPFKIAILDKAHLMPPDSQNCLLKTLEEPKNSILILITENEEMLFETIKSRCQIIKFFPVKKEKVEKFLIEKGIEAEKAKKIASLSEGRPIRAIEFLDQGKLEEWERQIRDFEKILKSPLNFRFKYIRHLIEEGKENEVLENWIFHLRKIFIQKLKERDLVFKNLKEKITFLERIYSLLSRKKINKRLALEILMLEL
jgi:DNA polymerase-3 subunit delta'